MDDVTAMAQQLRSDDQELLQGLLHTLQSRHAAGLVFTRLGSMLIALNPLRSLPQFCSREERTRHLRALDRELPPHIFELGTRALAAVASEGESQCISLLGPVGSGKTFLAQRLLQQLTLGAPGAAPLEEPLSRGNALLDFLGSVRTADVVAGLPPPPTATTPRTARAQEAPPPATLPAHLSTCFCRASLLYFRADGRVAVGRVHTVLLGRGGLLPEPPPPGAGLQREGLQCLRALLAIDPRLATDLHLTEARASRYVCGAPTEEDGQRVREASAAMAAVGMAAEQQRAVWRALAAVLHLGCLRAPPPAAPTAADEVAAPLRLAATLLGVSAEALHRALSSSHRGAASAAASAARDPAAAMAQAHYLPPTAYRLPLSSYHSPLTTHHSPLTTHHSPPTTHHPPLTTHHSPLTTHHSLLTGPRHIAARAVPAPRLRGRSHQRRAPAAARAPTTLGRPRRRTAPGSEHDALCGRARGTSRAKAGRGRGGRTTRATEGLWRRACLGACVRGAAWRAARGASSRGP